VVIAEVASMSMLIGREERKEGTEGDDFIFLWVELIPR